MTDHLKKVKSILDDAKVKKVRVETLGQFRVWVDGEAIHPKEWGRDKTVQLFQFLITSRHRRGLHKEQIIDRLWEDIDGKVGDRDFKVAMHGINKALEPNRKSRAEPKFIHRQGLTYQLNDEAIWFDVQALEDLISIGNQALDQDRVASIAAYSEAVKMYSGPYLPDRLFEDWTSEERERIQVLILGTMVHLAQLLVDNNPMESIRLCQKAIQIDRTWEEAYRIQMEAYINRGNRPQALKSYAECEHVLNEEFGIQPLPQTKSLLKSIEAIGI